MSLEEELIDLNKEVQSLPMGKIKSRINEAVALYQEGDKSQKEKILVLLYLLEPLVVDRFVGEGENLVRTRFEEERGKKPYLQELLDKALKKPDFRASGAGAFFVTSIHNRIRDSRRAISRRREVPLNTKDSESEEGYEIESVNLGQVHDNPVDHAAGFEGMERMEHVILRAAKEMGRPILETFRDWCSGLKYKEISENSGGTVVVGTVKSRLASARKVVIGVARKEGVNVRELLAAIDGNGFESSHMLAAMDQIIAGKEMPANPGNAKYNYGGLSGRIIENRRDVGETKKE